MNTKSLLKLAFAATLLVFAALPAKADLYLEPYVGYQVGTFTHNVSSVSGTVSGTAAGLRVGLSLPIFFVAAEYSLANGTMKPSSGSDLDVTGKTLFATVGARLPLIRAYAGYGIMNDWDTKVSGGSTGTYKGSAIKLGAGFSGLPFIAVNVEYVMSTFTKYKVGSSESNTDMKSGTYMLNVSLPLSI
jgi:hypothetical protein